MVFFVSPLLDCDSAAGLLPDAHQRCSMFRSVSLINVRGCSTLDLTLIYVLLLLYWEHVPQPCLYIVVFFFLYRQHFWTIYGPVQS